MANVTNWYLWYLKSCYEMSKNLKRYWVSYIAMKARNFGRYFVAIFNTRWKDRGKENYFWILPFMVWANRLFITFYIKIIFKFRIRVGTVIESVVKNVQNVAVGAVAVVVDAVVDVGTADGAVVGAGGVVGGAAASASFCFLLLLLFLLLQL